MKSIEHRARVENSQRTHTLLAALKMLDGTDFSTMMGSGIMVNLRPITEERRLADEFMLNAEDMAAIAPLMAKSIREALERRTIMLKSELADIDKALGPKT